MNSFHFLNKDARDALNFDYHEADKKMMWILWVHAFFAIFVTSHYYQTITLGAIGSFVLLGLTSVAYFTLRGTLWFRIIAALAIMGFSVVEPIKRISPSSIAGRMLSDCALLQRWHSSSSR